MEQRPEIVPHFTPRRLVGTFASGIVQHVSEHLDRLRERPGGSDAQFHRREQNAPQPASRREGQGPTKPLELPIAFATLTVALLALIEPSIGRPATRVEVTQGPQSVTLVTALEVRGQQLLHGR